MVIFEFIARFCSISSSATSQYLILMRSTFMKQGVSWNFFLCSHQRTLLLNRKFALPPQFSLRLVLRMTAEFTNLFDPYVLAVKCLLGGLISGG